MTKVAEPLDVDQILSRLKFVTSDKDNAKTRTLRIAQAITAPPAFARTIDGASTLEVTVHDADRVLVRSKATQYRSWAVMDDVHFELVALTKAGDFYTLTFEDAIVAKLRRQTSAKRWPRNTVNRRQIALWLAKEAGVTAVVDPGHTEKVHNPLARSADGPKTNSWDFLGADVAEPIHWRRFSDGRRLVVGSDDWLMKRDKSVTTIREHAGPFGAVDFDLDVGKRASRATVELHTERWVHPPGSVVELEDLGPADGKWLVQTYRGTLTSTAATLELIRKRHELPEPKATASGGRGDGGEDGFLPGMDGGTAAGAPAATSSARERMVQFALSKNGGPYVWGGKGPTGYDCSGLVQDATEAAGNTLYAPSASQAARVAAAGKSMSIDAAIRTRGALLFRMGSPYNHVAISLGNGSTIEAMGSAYGIRIGSAHGRGWTSAGWWV